MYERNSLVKCPLYFSKESIELEEEAFESYYQYRIKINLIDCERMY